MSVIIRSRVPDGHDPKVRSVHSQGKLPGRRPIRPSASWSASASPQEKAHQLSMRAAQLQACLSEWTATGLLLCFCLSVRVVNSKGRNQSWRGSLRLRPVKSPAQHLIPCTRSGARLRLSIGDWELAGLRYAARVTCDWLAGPPTSRPVHRPPSASNKYGDGAV